MTRTFAEESRAENFPGLLVDFDHASHDPAQPSTAAGWIHALEHRPGGLYAKIRWSDLGHDALTGGRYRLASPVWNRSDCDQWTAPNADGQDVPHLRPRRLHRLALTNDPNLPGLMPLSNRKEEVRRKKEEVPISAPSTFCLPTSTLPMNLRTEILNHLHLAAAATDTEILGALRAQWTELETVRNRCSRLAEAQADADLERFADVIVNREIVRGQLLANRDGTLALLGALRTPAAPAPLHNPRAHRPSLSLLSPIAPEPDPAVARRIANRARELQSQLKLSHHAAFRLAEGEALEPATA
jgi:phage I-like protein